MRVLVTGGAGYIGSVIVARLTARGHDVVVYDSLFRGHAAAVPAGVALVRGDVRDTAAVRAALEDGGCEAVVHMAALAEVGESVAEPGWYRSVNEEGTAAVVRAAVAAGAGRLVFSSTAAVYGAPERTPIDEDDALAPANPYGETKLAGERLLQQARSRGELAATALRYFNACGADGACGEDHDPESHLIPLALRAARDGTPIRVFGADYPTPDGTCVRDYVHVADLADAHIAALEALPGVQGSFNLGTGTGDSVQTVLDAVEAITGRTLLRETAPRRAGDPPVLVASNRRAHEELGWRPRRSLTDAVSDAWAWMRAHPDGYAER
jgi:UDP-glucose 4-epimerase